MPLALNANLSFDEPALVIGEYEIAVTVKALGADGTPAPVREPIRQRVTIQERTSTEVVVTVDLR